MARTTRVANGEVLEDPKPKSAIIHYQDDRKPQAAHVALVDKRPYVSIRWAPGKPFDHISWDEIRKVERVSRPGDDSA